MTTKDKLEQAAITLHANNFNGQAKLVLKAATELETLTASLAEVTRENRELKNQSEYIRAFGPTEEEIEEFIKNPPKLSPEDEASLAFAKDSFPTTLRECVGRLNAEAELKTIKSRLSTAEAENKGLRETIQHAYNWKKDLHPNLIQDLEKALFPTPTTKKGQNEV